MDNAAIADNFSLLSKLMDIHGENAFKTRSYSIAAYHIENLDTPLRDTPRELIPGIKGLSGSIGQKVIEMLDTGKLSVLDELITNTPPGIIEMLHIKGIGPKKIHTIWKEMEIESIGELLYACDENRLTRFKGFGEKTQQNIREGIEYYLQHQGHFLYAEMEVFFPQIDAYLRKLFGDDKAAVTGAYRRQDLTLHELEYIILAPAAEVKPKFVSAQPPELLEDTPSTLLYKLKNGLNLRLYTGETNMAVAQFRHTGSAVFVETFESAHPSAIANSTSEDTIFKNAGLPVILPCLRELPHILEKAGQGLPQLIEPADIKGIIHSHSTWSDGSHTLEEMARACQTKGFEYLVISDHSRSATYAKGLSEERIHQQHEEIERLNTQLAPFRIFKSIECDILTDGSLDYSDDVLASFDLVIASVHSNLKMTEEKAMMRLIKAITHPAVTILGHPTGRLLLSRRGYPVDHQQLIDACAAHNVVIEINAHPRRLDLDWQWIPYALEKKVLLSINPDAHSTEGFDDIKYGVLAAQKGGLSKEFNLSSKSLAEFDTFLKRKK